MSVVHDDQLRQRLQQRAGAILEALTEALRAQGIGGVQVVGFQVAPDDDQRFEVGARELTMRGGVERSVDCPTICERQRDGTILCYPSC